MRMRKVFRLILRIAFLAVGLLVAALAFVVATPQPGQETRKRSDPSAHVVLPADGDGGGGSFSGPQGDDQEVSRGKDSEQAIAEERARIDAEINDLLVYASIVFFGVQYMQGGVVIPLGGGLANDAPTARVALAGFVLRTFTFVVYLFAIW